MQNEEPSRLVVAVAADAAAFAAQVVTPDAAVVVTAIAAVVVAAAAALIETAAGIDESDTTLIPVVNVQRGEPLGQEAAA